MEIFWIIVGVFILYWRTLDYKYLIDDIVRRWGYLYCVPETAPPPEFYNETPHWWRHLWLIITHGMNIFLIGYMWGWEVALIFAVFPINVTCTAWITGGYYSLTTFFTLTAWFFVTQYPNYIGGFIGSIFFTAALGSTITCVGFPFIFLFFGPKVGLMFLWPLVAYVFGKRFTTGFKIRDDGKRDKVSWRKIAVVIKTTAYYAWLTVYPNNLAFFRQFGFDYTRKKHEKMVMDSFNKHFWVSLVGLAAFVAVGWHFSPLGITWWLLGILPFSQYKLLGQFVAERYLYLPTIGWCLIVASAIGGNAILLTVLVTLYAYRSHLYIPAYASIEDMYKNGIQNYPKCSSNYCNLAERFLHTGDTYTSMKLLSQALELDPQSFLAHVNLAAYWGSVRDWKKALYHCDLGVEYATPGSKVQQLMMNQHNELTDIIKKESEKWAGNGKRLRQGSSGTRKKGGSRNLPVR